VRVFVNVVSANAGGTEAEIGRGQVMMYGFVGYDLDAWLEELEFG
jgi:hypothetical protein